MSAVNSEIDLAKKDLERYKKVRIAKEVKRFDYVVPSINELKHDVISYGDILYNKIDLIKSINLKQVKKVKNEIDFDNVSIVVGKINKKSS